jgi:TRAP-type C4-dicarboxylate transport system substrate-binding protein
MSFVAAQASAKDLVYGSWNGPKNVVLTEGVGPYLKTVSEASKGSMQWKMVAGAQLFDGRATLSGIKNRLADAGGPVIPAFTRKALRSANVIYDLIHLSDSPVVMAGAVAETYHLSCPACKADFKKNGSIFIANYAAAPFTLLCRMPVKTAADVKGKKVRVVGALGRFIKSLGAVPVGGPPTKAVQAVQRGNMDCIAGPVSWIKSFGMWDITKHVLDVSLAVQATPSSMVINEKIWKGMSKADRALMIRHAPSLIANTTIKGYMAEDVEVRSEATKRGISIVRAGKAFKALLDAHEVKEPKIIAAVAKKEGVKDADSIIDAHRKNVAKWKKIHATIGDDPDKFAKALWDEVFSKLDPENM